MIGGLGKGLAGHTERAGKVRLSLLVRSRDPSPMVSVVLGLRPPNGRDGRGFSYWGQGPRAPDTSLPGTWAGRLRDWGIGKSSLRGVKPGREGSALGRVRRTTAPNREPLHLRAWPGKELSRLKRTSRSKDSRIRLVNVPRHRRSPFEIVK